MAEAEKATVTLDGVPLAGTAAVVWRFVTGVVPYTTTLQVHKRAWDEKLAGKAGQPLTLKITDSRGVETAIEHVYILHTAPTDSPNRVTFVVADKRWRWAYPLIVRDFNMPRKTGSRTALGTVPVELTTVVDTYDYLAYSLRDGKRWTPKQAIEDVLQQLEGDAAAGGFRIEGFPIADTNGAGTAGEFTLQGVTLRDQGDAALGRLLSYVPGAEVYIDARGAAVVFDGTDLDAVEQHFRELPPTTWAGEYAAWINRAAIRPAKVVAHYQREVEILLRFEDDYRGTTQSQPSRSEPYLENVLPTVDPETEITEFDPQQGAFTSKVVPPGTWVRVDRWLAAMDADRPADSFPWTFDTIRTHWLKGDLDGVLGGKGLDLDREANVALRIAALKQHFRQTFRLNRRYVEASRELLPVRVALLDPVTGARAPAAVWGQACVIPSRKDYMTSRLDPSRQKVYRNVDYLAPSESGGSPIISTPPGPASVVFVDRELGIFRLEWIASPYGLTEAFVPCNLVDTNGTPTVVTRDLAQQDTQPMGAGLQVESGTNGIFLSPRLRFAVLLTMVPSAPNNANQFHRIEVEASNVQSLFRREFRLQNGDGPELHVFVPPGEVTARFAWRDEQQASSTIQDLVGLRGDGDVPGIEGTDLPGFVLANEERHLTDHALSLAAELLAPYADSVQGNVATRVPTNGLRLVGNMAGAAIRVGVAPSAKVDALHQFPGQQRAVSRLAVMPEGARRIILGTLPFRS